MILLKNKKAEGWPLPSIFGAVGIFLFIGGFFGFGFWLGALGFIFIIVSILLWFYRPSHVGIT